MLEPTKRRSTDTVQLRFIGPAAAEDETARLLKALGFESAEGAIPWRTMPCPFGMKSFPGLALPACATGRGFPSARGIGFFKRAD
jgi:hypothetical protein